MFAVEYHDASGKAIFKKCQYLADVFEAIRNLIGEGVHNITVMRISDAQNVVAPNS